MAAKHKFFEYYSLGCCTVRTEVLALFTALLFLLVHSAILCAALQGHASLFRLCPASLFYVFACCALLFAQFTDRPSYALVFLVFNAINIFALSLAFIALLALGTDPAMRDAFIAGILTGTYQETALPEQTSEDRYFFAAADLTTNVSFLRYFGLCSATLLLLTQHTLAQGIVFHFYRFARCRKAERFERPSVERINSTSMQRRLQGLQSVHDRTLQQQNAFGYRAKKF